MDPFSAASAASGAVAFLGLLPLGKNRKGANHHSVWGDTCQCFLKVLEIPLTSGRGECLLETTSVDQVYNVLGSAGADARQQRSEFTSRQLHKPPVWLPISKIASLGPTVQTWTMSQDLEKLLRWERTYVLCSHSGGLLFGCGPSTSTPPKQC